MERTITMGGSQISPEVGRHDPEHVVGVHVTQLFSFPSGDPSEFADLSEQDHAALQFLQQFTANGGLAYNQYQSAQPQTLAYALQDSPAGCPHAFANPGTAPARMLFIVGPPGHEQYLDQLADLVARPGPPDQAAIEQLRLRYDIHQLTALVPGRG